MAKLRHEEKMVRAHIHLPEADLRQISVLFPGVDRSTIIRASLRSFLRFYLEKMNQKAKPLDGVEVDVGDLVKEAGGTTG